MKTKCLMPLCPNDAWSRGLCITCLSHARHLIQRGEITEAELIESGKLLPPRRTRGPSERGSARRKWFLEGK